MNNNDSNRMVIIAINLVLENKLPLLLSRLVLGENSLVVKNSSSYLNILFLVIFVNRFCTILIHENYHIGEIFNKDENIQTIDCHQCS